jgi:heat shock protein HspQ
MIEHKFDLGDTLKEKVTGVVGVVLGITKYATDCIHYGIQAKIKPDGSIPEWHWFDESRLDKVDGEKVVFNLAKGVTSGSFTDAPSM